MELRDIEYFAVLAEHGHFGRAAAALGITQPALSKSLQRLETVLEVQLMRRTAKGVELTAEGLALQVRARELRLSLQSVAREIKEIGEGRHFGGLSGGCVRQASPRRATHDAQCDRFGQRRDGAGAPEGRTRPDRQLH